MDKVTDDDGTLQEIKALFGDLDSEGFQKGMLAWILQTKLATDPSRSIALITNLIKQLTKKIRNVNQYQKVRSYMSIIPMMHTLHYAVIQSGVMIPTELNQRVTECLKEVLKLPSPHSAVALKVLRNIKMEIKTPGFLYWKKVLSEQNLKNESFPQQERVFVFADPAVISASIEAKIQSYFKMSGFLKSVNNVQKRMIKHVLQTGLESNERKDLDSALEALDEADVKTFFKEVNIAVMQSSTGGANANANANEDYLNALQRIYTEIVAATKEGPSSEDDDGFLHCTTLPFPDFKFLSWEKNDELWDQLASFSLNNKRDSGIEKDIKEDETQASAEVKPRLERKRKVVKPQKSTEQMRLMSEKMERMTVSGSTSDVSRTAKVVFMGDDRVLGRLTNIYHSIRKKESKHNLLTKKLNLLLFYIPVTDSYGESLGDKMSVASYLGQIDPWYQRNVLSLVDPFSNPSDQPSVSDEPSPLDLYLLDSMCYYLRCGTQTTNLPLYSVKLTSEDEVVEDVFVTHLHANIPGCVENNPKKSILGRRRSSAPPPGAVVVVSYKQLSISQRDDDVNTSVRASGFSIRSEPDVCTSAQHSLIIDFASLDPEFKGIHVKSIKVETTDLWRFSVVLDRDARRTFHDVKRINVAPCLDPGCDIRPLHGTSRELPLSKYLDNVLSLPINTFTGLNM